MINYKPLLVQNLLELFHNKIQVVAENFMTEDITFPCISYNLSNDVVRADGDDFGYSDIYYNIKVWGFTIADMEPIAQKIDEMMRSKGFTRIATNELWNRGLGQKSMRYQGLGRELF